MHITRRAHELSAMSRLVCICIMPWPLQLRLRRRLADDDPALELRDRPRLLDRDGVADLLGLVLDVRVVVLRPAHGLLEQRVGEAALDLHHKRLLLLVAHDDALQDSLRHGLLSPWPWREGASARRRS